MATGPLIVIVGETASGKSALAHEIARRLNGEIICADSWTVRREVSIGTAKPSPAERTEVPHHVLDVVGPCEDFTAAVFKELAVQAIEEITERGRLPIMVGGTGLYVDSVLYDYGFMAQGDRTARAQLNLLSNDELLSLIHEQGIDTSHVDIRNKRRLIRLLETGGGQPERAAAMRPNTLLIGIRTGHELLRERITARVDTMIQAGLEDEVRMLVEQYGWSCEALKGVGYAQWKGYFEGVSTLEETRHKIISATVALAKRQRTWFKRNKSIQWTESPVAFDDVEPMITSFLSTD
jgi:tRNA dimethylallyltransferase